MGIRLCARFRQEGGVVSVLDTKISDPAQREREVRAMPYLVWLVRKAAVIETYSAEPLFEKPADVTRFTPYERESIVLYARQGRLDDLTDYPVTACDTRWDLVVGSSPAEREEYEYRYDPVYRSTEAPSSAYQMVA